jgi:hypothetical protein
MLLGLAPWPAARRVAPLNSQAAGWPRLLRGPQACRGACPLRACSYSVPSDNLVITSVASTAGEGSCTLAQLPALAEHCLGRALPWLITAICPGRALPWKLRALAAASCSP